MHETIYLQGAAMANFEMFGDTYSQGHIAFNGKNHVLVGDDYEVYCNTHCTDDRFYNDRDFNPEKHMDQITCKKCRSAFELDYFNWRVLKALGAT